MAATQMIEVDEDLDYLRSRNPPRPPAFGREIAIVDLFSGCGGLTLGAIEGARRSGRPASLALAIDRELDPLTVLRTALDAEAGTVVQADLGTILRPVSEPMSAAERELLRVADGADLLVAGPPCQGHSALNNHTRHDDARNDLYVAVARAAELLRPRVVLVENVRGVGRDRRRSASRCRTSLEQLGYEVTEGRLDLSALGVPQTRIRHVLIACRDGSLSWSLHQREARSVGWAIRDLLDQEGRTAFDTASTATVENRRRIDWLFDNHAYNLDNRERPPCHRSDHSYVSMYGRLWWDRPAQTITTGFGSMGQGRFIHPLRRRTLTPHEAARLQCLPDFLPFAEVPRRGAWATMIGNAAPPMLAMALVEALVAERLL